MASYYGNIFGDKRLYVFSRTSGTGASQANFVKTIPIASYPGLEGATTAYVSAGGPTYGTTGELLPFVSNSAYEQFARAETRRLTTLDEATGGVTSTIVSYSPDPRSHISVYTARGATDGITGNHMDEIHVTANDGNTYQAFLGRILYSEDDPTVGTTQAMVELIAYGISGSADPSGLYAQQAGKTLVNKTNGVGVTVANSHVLEFIDLESYKLTIQGQIAKSVEESGMTGTTIGDANQKQSVFFKSSDPALISFVSTLLPAFANGATGISAAHENFRQREIFTLHAGTTGDLSEVLDTGVGAIFGVTLNAVTGGTLAGQSAFEEFANVVLHHHAESLSVRDSLNYRVRTLNSIRDVDDVSF